MNTPLWTKLKRFDLRDDRLRVQQVERQQRDEFFAGIHEVLNVPGATAFFSWPSRGSVTAYPADEATIEASEQTRGQVKFGQVFLADPDVDQDRFLDLARLYPEHSERTTLYASDGDQPVHLSAKLHDAPRAGYFAPYTVAPGIDTVAVPDFDLDLLGHAYFAQADALLNDMADLIGRDEAPASRQRIKPDLHNGTSFWKLRR